MRLFKRGAVYWFELVYEGQRIQRSTKLRKIRDAEKYASAFHTALAMGNVGIIKRKPVPNFTSAMAAFLRWSATEHRAHPATALRYKVSSLALLRYFGSIPLDQITVEFVEQFKAERAGEFSTSRDGDGRKATNKLVRPASVNRELACLRAMFNHAMKANHILRNPVSRVKFMAENNQQERVLTLSEQRAYLLAATQLLRDIAGMILETGMRPEEVYTLRASAVDLESGFLKVVRGKTPAAKRRLELTAEARRILSSRIGPDTDWLFPSKRDASKSIPKVNNAHDRAVITSKVPKFRLYDLRHTWATRAAEAGVDLVTLAAMMGHSRIQMVMRYAHPTQGHQASAMQKVEKHVAATAAKEKAAASGMKIVKAS